MHGIITSVRWIVPRGIRIWVLRQSVPELPLDDNFTLDGKRAGLPT